MPTPNPTKRTNPDQPKPKQARPNRQEFKKQVTVRINKKILEMTNRWCKANKKYLTEALEEALWKWIQEWQRQTRQRPAEGEEDAIRLKMLCDALPLEKERLAMASLAYCENKHDDLVRDTLRRLWEKEMEAYSQDPLSTYKPTLYAISRRKPVEESSRGAA